MKTMILPDCFLQEPDPAIRFIFYCVALHKKIPLLSGLGFYRSNLFIVYNKFTCVEKT